MKLGRKLTGGKYKAHGKKKLTGSRGQQRIVKLGEKKTKVLKGRGSIKKIVSLSQKEVNVSDGKKSRKLEITNVVATPSNRFWARQNILVKGSVVETKQGKVKITNRPSQEGIVQGILLKDE